MLLVRPDDLLVEDFVVEEEFLPFFDFWAVFGDYWDFLSFLIGFDFGNNLDFADFFVISSESPLKTSKNLAY